MKKIKEAFFKFCLVRCSTQFASTAVQSKHSSKVLKKKKLAGQINLINFII